MENKDIRLILNNIGIIKNANLKINGLSVIAGKNDQGKSTAGKALMALIKADNIGKESHQKHSQQKQYFKRLISLIFDGNISKDGKIHLQNKNRDIIVKIKDDKCSSFESNGKACIFRDCTLIQTPIIWDLCEFFSSTATLEVYENFYQKVTYIKYPYVLWDLYKKLSIKKQYNMPQTNIKKILESIKSVMKGQFIKKNNKFYFSRPRDEGGIDEISLKNTATGIKSFGIIQMLLENAYITKTGFFVFDEPENHLHPVWQVKFAEIFIELVEKGICIMINTHSPYMIETLEKCSKKSKINANFYLADNGEIKQIDDDNNATLEAIFQKLNDSFVEIDKIDEIEKEND